MTIRIKNWSQFQHFKDRKPPWVKLYRDLLDDMDWHQLDPKAAKTLVMLWLIASEFNGELPPIKKLSFRLRLSEKDTEDVIFKLSHWLEQDDISVISECNQVVTPETEGETEKETKEKRDSAPPDGVSLSVWQDFLKLRKTKKAPVTDTAIAGIRREALKAGMGLSEALATCCQRGWTGFKADWVAQQGLAVTVTKPDVPDPALEKLERDRKLAAPMPESVRKEFERLRVSPSMKIDGVA